MKERGWEGRRGDEGRGERGKDGRREGREEGRGEGGEEGRGEGERRGEGEIRNRKSVHKGKLHRPTQRVPSYFCLFLQELCSLPHLLQILLLAYVLLN